MLTYEDEQSLSDRCDFVNSNGYGGVIIWEISNDDPQGFPMTTIIANKMLGGDNLPSAPVLSVDNGTNNGNYTITVNIPAGNTATSMALSENSNVVKTVNITPSAIGQVISYVVINKAVGTYTYVGQLSNAYGATSSNPLLVTVTGQPSGNEWVPNKAYNAGDVVTYNNKSYKCLQSHTSLVGWEPDNAPALWQLQ
jgi:chitinase